MTSWSNRSAKVDPTVFPLPFNRLFSTLCLRMSFLQDFVNYSKVMLTISGVQLNLTGKTLVPIPFEIKIFFPFSFTKPLAYR